MKLMSENEDLMMIPGPVRIPKDARQAMAKQMISHRGPRFENLHERCEDKLQTVFETNNDVVIISGMGYAAIETAMANCVHEDDTVLCHQNGKFGLGMEDIADRYAGDTVRVADEWGSPVDFDGIEAGLEAGADVVTMVHGETTTGMVNPIEDAARLADEYDALFIADCVTSIGGEELDIDGWGIDIAVTASQKCIGAPPGLSALSLSDEAMDRVDAGAAPYYLDLEEYLDIREIHQTPTTCVVPLYRALHKRLESIVDEGLDDYRRHMATRAKALREAGYAMGIDQFATLDDRTKYSNAVTVYQVPDGITTDEIIKGMAAQNVTIRGGLQDLYEDSIRIGTMGGAIGREQILRTVEVFQDVLESSTFEVQGDGVGAAASVLD